MKKGLLTLKGAMTALFVAAFFAIVGSSFGAIKAEAYVSIKRPDATGKYNTKYEGETINIYSKRLNKNVIKVKLDDTNDKQLINAKGTNGLKYKITKKLVSSDGDSIEYLLSFYCKKNNTKVSTFKFYVDGQMYKVKFFSNKFDPIKQIKYGKERLSTEAGKFGSANYITDLEKEKVSIEMNGGYSIRSIQVGKYTRPTDAALTWSNYTPGKKLKLSKVVHQVTAADGVSYDSDILAVTVIRVNYHIDGTRFDGYVDYYLNKLIED